MPHNFASITEMPGTPLTPEQYARYLHRYAFGLRAAAPAEPPARVLEVGCGAASGLSAWHDALHSCGGLAVGLEYVESTLQLARAKLGAGPPLLAGDAQRLPFASDSFDAIAAFEVIYYLPDLPAFLRESRRVLAPGGRLILCWSNPEWRDFAPGRHSGYYPAGAEVAALLPQAGFAETTLYGAFPSTQSSAKARWVNRFRRIAVRTGLTTALGALTAPLMRAAYGELTPLPTRLALQELEDFEPTSTRLHSLSTDSIHRALYAVATV